MTEIRQSLKIRLPSDLKKLALAFEQADAKLFVVGGAVRDALLGQTPKDFDVATELEPTEVIRLISRRFPTWTFIPVGEAFGIVMVRTDNDEQFEIATFRKDIGDGRRPDAVEVCNIETDVLRRDRTINALFFDISTNEVVDLVGGIKDLRENIVRAVGNPFERFREDRLRVLRAVRFAARFDGSIEKSTKHAMIEHSVLKGFVSPERIRDEFLKGLKSAVSVRTFFNLLAGFDLIREVFGTGLDVVACPEVRDPVVLLGVALRGDKIQNQLKALKWGARESVQVDFLRQLVTFESKDALLMKKRLVSQARLTDGQLCSFAALCDNADVVRNVDALMRFDASVKAEDLMNEGFKGRELGAKLAELEADNFRALLR